MCPCIIEYVLLRKNVFSYIRMCSTQFNAFMDDFRSASCKENLDAFFSNLILRQSPSVPGTIECVLLP